MNSVAMSTFLGYSEYPYFTLIPHSEVSGERCACVCVRTLTMV